MKIEFQYEKAEKLYNRKNYTRAIKMYKQLAKSGSIESCHFVGWMYERGLGVTRNDEEAFKWYGKAAKTGLATSQFHFAKWYFRQNNYDLSS